MNIVEEKKWLPESQSGFRKERGIMNNLFLLTSIMEETRYKRKPLFMAFVDLRKAYERGEPL